MYSFAFLVGRFSELSLYPELLDRTSILQESPLGLKESIERTNLSLMIITTGT